MASRCAGASVLCYTTDDENTPCILLGQDSDGTHQWSDFGGGAHRLEPEAICATRELKEEVMGLISGSRVTNSPQFQFQFRDKKNRLRHYTTYVMPVAYMADLGNRFLARRLNLRCQSRDAASSNPRLEKRAIAYFERADLPWSELRPFFRTRLSSILPVLKSTQWTPKPGIVATIDIHTP